MSATMAIQGGWVQLELSKMHMALNMAIMAKGEFLRAAIEEMQYLIKKPWVKVPEEKKRVVEFPVHLKVNAAIDRHPALLCQNHINWFLPCKCDTRKNPEMPCRCKETDAPQLDRPRQPTPEPTPPPHGMPPWLGTPPTPSCNNSGAHCSKSTICWPDMRIHNCSFPTLNFLLLRRIPRIASTIQILIQIFAQMKDHPPVSPLSAVW